MSQEDDLSKPCGHPADVRCTRCKRHEAHMIALYIGTDLAGFDEWRGYRADEMARYIVTLLNGMAR